MEIRKTNADLIKRAIKDFDWENKLSLIDINDQVVLFNETIVNIMSNFIPNETITFDDRDPPWFNKNIKNMINYKNAIFNKSICHNDSHLQLRLRYFQDLLNIKIEQAKGKYFENISHKLTNKNLNPKKYWSLLKIILNGRKIPLPNIAYLQFTIMTNLYLNVISLIHILQISGHLW